MRASNFAFYALHKTFNFIINNFPAQRLYRFITTTISELILKAAFRIFGVNAIYKFILYFERQDPTGRDPILGEIGLRLPASQIAPELNVTAANSKKYIFVRKLAPEIEAGKNTGACLVFSLSKDHADKRKSFVYKPLYDRVIVEDKGVLKESRSLITDATSEVFAAWIAVILAGKNHAAKTKFSVEERGVVSRILGDNFANTINLFNYFIDEDGNFFAKSLPVQAQSSFLFVLVLNIVLTNRDLHIDNMVLNFNDPNEKFIYMIDNEFALSEPRRHGSIFTLKKLLDHLYEDPKYFAKVCFDINCKWNDTSGYNLTDQQLNIIADKMCGFLTKEAFIATLHEVSTALSSDNFAICAAAKEKTLKQLLMAPQLYPAEEINTKVIPRIDSATMELKRSIKVVQIFLDRLREEKTNENTLSPAKCTLGQ